MRMASLSCGFGSGRIDRVYPPPDHATGFGSGDSDRVESPPDQAAFNVLGSIDFAVNKDCYNE